MQNPTGRIDRSNFIPEWETSARPLLLIDEIRVDGPPTVRQFVFFIVLRTNTTTAVEWMRSALHVRGAMPVQSRNARLKGARRQWVLPTSDNYFSRS